MKRLLLFLLFGSTIAAASGWAQESVGTTSRAELQPGDRFELSVWRNPELSGTIAIADDGVVIHPLYSEVQVVRVPLSTARERLHTFLQRF